MSNLPSSMITVLSLFFPLFSLPSYNNFLFLFYGHVLCKGRRTITEILKRMGLKEIKNFSKYHDFFRRAKWSALKGAQILFVKLIALVPGEVIISVDSTVERRKGPKIKSLGIQRDAVRSTKSRKVLVPGLHWLVFAIHINFPWCGNRSWALPFLSILMAPEKPLSSTKNKTDLSKKKKHKTMIEWTCQTVGLLRKWAGPSKKITIVADSAFATYALANKCIDCGVTLISRMRMDARTFKFPSESKSKKGRKRIVGERLPTFKDMLIDPNLEWSSMDVDWYGGQRKKLEFIELSCLWYGYGIRPVPIKCVLTRVPNNNETCTVIFSTDLDMTAEHVIGAFVCRWELEVTFEEARRHLGMETQRQSSDNAIDRTTPSILASYSIINLIVLESLTATKKNISIQTNSWYKKSHVTFSDVLAYLRREILEEKYFSQFGKKADLWFMEFKELIDQMTAA